MEDLDFEFDDLLFQTAKGRNACSLEHQIRDWNLKFGYKFNIYSNDHLIDGKPHFHFDNEAQDIFCKLDFEGNVLESSGNRKISSKVHKELISFLSKKRIKRSIVDKWNEKNPDLKQSIIEFDE